VDNPENHDFVISDTQDTGQGNQNNNTAQKTKEYEQTQVVVSYKTPTALLIQSINKR
jgi:hypothetical protein